MIQGPLIRVLWEGEWAGLWTPHFSDSAPVPPMRSTLHTGFLYRFWFEEKVLQVKIVRVPLDTPNGLCSMNIHWLSDHGTSSTSSTFPESRIELGIEFLPSQQKISPSLLPCPPHLYSDFRPTCLCSCWECRFLTFGYSGALGTAWGREALGVLLGKGGRIGKAGKLG